MKINLKKIISVSLAAMMIATLFTACSDNSKKETDDASSLSGLTQVEEKTKVNVGVLKDVSAFGMLKLMSDDKDDYANNDYTFDVYTSIDNLTPNIKNETIDIAVIPTAAAAKYYNQNDKSISVIAVSSLGTYTVVSNGENIASIADLKGKTVYTTGKGTEVEAIINYVLDKNSLKAGQDVTIEYKDSFADVEASVISSEAKIAILPQPNVTNAIKKNGSVSIALDIAAEWDKVSKDGELTHDCIIVRNGFLNENKEAVTAFMAEYYASTYNTTDKIDETSGYADEFGIFVPEIAERVVPFCNAYYSIRKDMKASISNYLNILYSANPEVIGSNNVDDGFFYVD